MTRSAVRALVVLAVAISVCTSSACSRDPGAMEERHVRVGDGYASQQKYREAVIEFRGAVQAMPGSGRAHLKLGDAYFRAGDPVNGTRELIRAADLLPGDAQTQMKAGSLLL